MPKRTDLKTILIIGAGPIIIGQACEFDYSGVQACKALREEGYRVVLINSNPATIMTDPATADVTYIEPITWQTVEKIIAKERPDAILPTMGGQTALNCALDLWRNGVLNKYRVELIGAKPEAIDKAEDRLKFKDAMTRIGLESARSGIAHSMDDAWAVQKKVGFPAVIRPASRSAARAAALPTTPRNSRPSASADWRPRPRTSCSSKSRCWAGKNSRWKSCATTRTTASSSARSRTSTPWACTPATRSPWRRRRRSRTRNTR